MKRMGGQAQAQGGMTGSRWVESLCVPLSAICTVSILLWALRSFHHGFEFTDEAYYLVWMANPSHYHSSASQFGFVYHPLYQWLDGNVAHLRQVSFLATFGLAWTVAYQFLKNAFAGRPWRIVDRLVVSSALATPVAASLMIDGMWLPTPGYNSLTLQAVLGTVLGWMLAERRVHWRSLAGWLLIGAGGWLAFMAKPPTAAAMGILTLAYLAAARRMEPRLLACAVGTAVSLLLMSALMIDGSVSGFVERLRTGAEQYRILGAGHSGLLRLDPLNFERASAWTLAVAFAATWLVVSRPFANSAAKASTVWAPLPLLFGCACLVVVFGFVGMGIDVPLLQGMVVIAIPGGVLLAALTMSSQSPDEIRWSASGLALPIAFVLLPFAYAFGTANNMWIAAAVGGVFWILAGVAGLGALQRRMTPTALLIPVALVVQLLGVVQVHSGRAHPYRQTMPLDTMGASIDVGRPGSSLTLSTPFAAYIGAIRQLARREGLPAGGPVIDLTGHSPGTLYAMGATNTGQVWTVGGYPGSEALATTMLNKSNCRELAGAWLLLEPDGPRRIPPEVLQVFGANLTADYENVGTIAKPSGVGGYTQEQSQSLWRPKRDLSLAARACEARRAQRP